MRMTAGLIVAMGAAVLLSACGGTKLMGKSLPDETQVIDGPTLALPPQFELRPPRQSADYESVLRAQKGVEAQNLITTGVSQSVVVSGTTGASVEGPAADAWLLDKASAQTGVTADPDVRSELATKTPEEIEAAKQKQAKKGLLERWFGFGNKDDE